MDVLKPYLMIAAAAFALGFTGYWAVGGGVSAASPTDGYSVSAPAAPAYDVSRRVI